jgi:meiotic recombination protein SPO11
VIEKDGVFRNLVEAGFCARIPSILLTGLGYPSVACRALVALLRRHLCIPVMGLFDFNPHGADILMCYKTASARLGIESVLHTVPDMHWIGTACSAAPVRCRGVWSAGALPVCLCLRRFAQVRY